MFTLIKSIYGPSAFEISLFCNFTSVTYKNLILCSANHLHIYNIISKEDDKHLNYIGKYEFLENIVSLSSLCLGDINTNALIVAFKDAKFSIVGFDSATFNLKTLSFHNYETDDFKAGFYNSHYIPKTTVDPSNQCVVMSFYNSYLAVLPLSISYDSTQDEIFSSNNYKSSDPVIPLTMKENSKNFKLPSSIVINLKDLTPKFTNLLDIKFLNGYFEPTLAILYEPSQTWPGKITTKQETVCLITISINLYQRVYPIIWSMTNLPYDSLKVIPVPRPLGGLLLLATNSILYLNQRATLPICTLALNSLAQASISRIPALTGRPQIPPLALSPGSVAIFFEPATALLPTDGTACARYLRVFLDSSGSSAGDPHSPVFSAQPTSINRRWQVPRDVPGDQSGDADDAVSRDLRRIHYKLTGGVGGGDMRMRFNVSLMDTFPDPYAYVRATDMCHCGENLVFIASHTSDSLLVRIEPYLEQAITLPLLETLNNSDLESKPPNVKLEFQDEEVSLEMSQVSQPLKESKSEYNESMDHNGLQEKGEEREKVDENTNIRRTYKLPPAAYIFIICDSLLNIGPCAQSTLGQPILSLTEDYGITDPLTVPDLELVVSSGRQQSGALTVLQKSVVPQLITTFHLPGVFNMWTLNQSPPGLADGGQLSIYPEVGEEWLNQYNSYLLLSMPDSTLVLKTGQEITEMESSGFNTQAPTLLAGNITGLNGTTYIVQITATSARLLLGHKQIHHLTFEIAGIPGTPLISAHMIDHYILLIGESSQITLLALNANYQTNTEQEFGEARLQVVHGSLGKIYAKPPIVAACIYKDDTGLFTSEHSAHSYFVGTNYGPQIVNNFERENFIKKFEEINSKTKAEIKAQNIQPPSKKIKVEPRAQAKDSSGDEVDELLYGESLLSTDITSSLENKMAPNETLISNNPDLKPEFVQDPFSTYLNTTTLKTNVDTASVEIENQIEQQRSPYVNVEDLKSKEATYWAAIARVNGSFEIYSLPQLKMAYKARNLHLKCDILSDENETKGPDQNLEKGLSLDQDDDVKQNLLDTYAIKEIALVSLCHNTNSTTTQAKSHDGPRDGERSVPNTPPRIYPKPYFLALINDSLLIYQIYPFKNPNSSLTPQAPDPVGDGHVERGGVLLPTLCDDAIMGTAHERLNIRFKKIHHNMLLGERKAAKSLPKKESAYKLFDVLRTTPVIRPFSDIDGYSGIFIQGLYPHWIMSGKHGDLKIHPQSIDGPAYAFAPFHNVNCQRGFLYFNHKEDLRIGTLPGHLIYDEDWLVRKVPINRTVHFVEYHIKMKVYVVVTSERVAAKRVVKNLNLNMAAFSAVNMGAAVVLPHSTLGSGPVPSEPEDEREFEDVNPDPTFPAPPQDLFYVDVIAPGTWEVVPSARLDFATEWERVTCFQLVSLASQVTVSGFKELLVMGTASVYGEDMTCRGRLIILDIIDVVPEPGKPMSKYKIKTLCATEQKGPLIALGSVSGNLVTVIGQKIYVWMLNNNNDLVGLAFIDTSLCVHRMATVKNLIIVGDLHKSITLLRYDPYSKTISVASREMSHLSVYGTQFLVDNDKLAFLATDHNKNVAIFMYQPQNRESFGGQRLVRKGDFHMGKNVSSLFRIFCKRKDPTSDKKPSLALERRQVTFFLGLDGSIGFILPINEKLYRRLLMLQNFMDANLFYTAGLNPKSSRAFKPTRQQLMNPARNVLDGNLLFNFMNMNALQQELISKNVGTSLDQIMDDLMEIDRTTNHF